MQHKNTSPEESLYDDLYNTLDSVYDTIPEDVYDTIPEDVYDSLYDSIPMESASMSPEDKQYIKENVDVFLSLVNNLDLMVENFLVTEDEPDEFLENFVTTNDMFIEVLANIGTKISEINSNLDQQNKIFENIQTEVVKIHEKLTSSASAMAMRSWGTEKSQLFSINVENKDYCLKIINNLEILPSFLTNIEEIAIYEEENPKVVLRLSREIKRTAQSLMSHISRVQTRMSGGRKPERMVRKDRNFNSNDILILNMIEGMKEELGKLLMNRGKMLKNSRRKVIASFANFNGMTCSLKKKLLDLRHTEIHCTTVQDRIEDIIEGITETMQARGKASFCLEGTCEYLNQLEHIRCDLKGIILDRKIYFSL